MTNSASDPPLRKLSDPGAAPRRPWLAVLLAILCLPAGFAYVGRLAWYIVAWLLTVAALVLAGRAGWLLSPQGLLGYIALAVGVKIASIVFVWIFARAQRREYRLRWYNRWYFYPLLAAAVGVSTLLLVANRESMLGYATYRIPSGSMAPTVEPGDLIVVDTRPPTLASLRVGDIVVTDSIRRPGERNLRRIVALGGQHVVIDDTGLQVDGVLQAHTHQQGADLMAPNWMRFADVELDDDELYLMGDNRGNSVDSRTEGPYTRSQVHGKATAIWWSSDSRRLGALLSD